jgi:hypothetical protein
MIGADIYGWASRIDSLNALERAQLRQAADELERSIQVFPADAHPYDERISPGRALIVRLTVSARVDHGDSR